MIPASSQISRVTREALWCRRKGLAWAEARERIASRFGHLQPCNAVPNQGFLVIGWLYGEGFGDSLCKAVNCGYDTDCTGATLGALLGILGGPEAIPERWRAPVGDRIVLHRFTGDCDPPKDIGELAARTEALACKNVRERSDAAAFAEPGCDAGRHVAPPEGRTMLFRNELARRARGKDPQSAVALDEGGSAVEITLSYCGDPVLWPGIGRELGVSFEKDGGAVGADARLLVPEGWRVAPLDGPGRFLVTADDVPARNALRVEAEVAGAGVGASFTILGPAEAVGFPAGDNVPVCPGCRARIEACVCGRP